MGIVPRMAIRWDWLQPLVTVPYVPSLGPVHPEAVTPGLLADVTEIAGTGRFLPYDKDLRWGGRKDESVLAGAVVQEPGLVLVPVLSTRRASCVKVCVYSRDPREALSQAAELGRRLCARHDAGKGRLVWFLPPGSAPDPVAACGRVQMRAFGPGCPVPCRFPVSFGWTSWAGPSACRSACSRTSWPPMASRSSMPVSAGTAAPARC
jgi:hypothetical protein